MPVQKDVWVTGRFGPVLFYQSGGKFIARSLPKKVKKTKNMKARSKGFGVASKIAGHFRRQLEEVIIDKSKRISQAHLSGAFSRWIQRTPVRELESTASIPYADKLYFQEGYFGLEMWLSGIKITERGDQFIVSIPAVSERIISRDISNVRKLVFKIGATSAGVDSPEHKDVISHIIEHPVPLVESLAHEISVPNAELPGHVFMMVASMDVIYDRPPSDKKRIWGVSRIIRASYNSYH